MKIFLLWNTNVPHFLKYQIFIDMRKSKTLRVRITENQLKRLTDVLIEEELNKSELIREMIDKYVRSCRNPQKKDVVQEITKIKGRNTITPKNIK